MEQYLNALRTIMERGVDRPSRTGIATRGVFGMQMRYPLQEGFPAMTTKKLAFESVKAELLWFLSGSSDVKKLRELGSHIWDANAEADYWKPKAQFEGDVGRIYGVQWRAWRTHDGRTIDQLSDAIRRIKETPHDRRIMVTAWNPADLEEVALPPCHTLFQFFTAEGTLSLQMYQRSCDMFLGVPFNIASYALLLSLVAQVTGLVAGEFIHTLGDAHIYHNHFDQVREQLGRNPYPLPQLKLNLGVKSIDEFCMNDIALEYYQYHSSIKAPMAV